MSFHIGADISIGSIASIESIELIELIESMESIASFEAMDAHILLYIYIYMPDLTWLATRHIAHQSELLRFSSLALALLLVLLLIILKLYRRTQHPHRFQHAENPT